MTSQDGVRTKKVKLHNHRRVIYTEHTDLRGIDTELAPPLHTGGRPLSSEETVEEERWNQWGKILVFGVRHSYHVWRYPITSQIEVERRGEPVFFIALAEYDSNRSPTFNSLRPHCAKAPFPFCLSQYIDYTMGLEHGYILSYVYALHSNFALYFTPPGFVEDPLRSLARTQAFRSQLSHISKVFTGTDSSVEMEPPSVTTLFITSKPSPIVNQTFPSLPSSAWLGCRKGSIEAQVLHMGSMIAIGRQ